MNALIQNGADLILEDNLGLRPLHQAVAEGRIDMVRAILQSGKPFDIAARDEFGQTALHHTLVTWEPKPRRRDSIKLLLAAGAPLRVKDNQGRTPISQAFEDKQFEFLYWMLTGDLNFCERYSTFTDDEKAKWLADHQAECKEPEIQEQPTRDSAPNRSD